HLTIVLAEEIEEALVIALLHIEHAGHDLVIPARFLQPLAHQIAYAAARDLALHVQRVDSGPERLPLLSDSLEELVSDRFAPLAAAVPPGLGVVRRAHLNRQVGELDHRAVARNDAPFDHGFELAHVRRP